MQDTHAKGAGEFIPVIRQLNFKMGIPKKLRDIQEKDILQMDRHAVQEANPLYLVAVLMDEKERQKFYDQVAASFDKKASSAAMA